MFEDVVSVIKAGSSEAGSAPFAMMRSWAPTEKTARSARNTNRLFFISAS